MTYSAAFNIINCTPHDIRIQNTDGKLVCLLPHGEYLPRVQEEYTTTVQLRYEENTFNVREHYFNETVGLPPALNDGTFFIVSKIVAEANPLRRDLLFVSKSYTINGVRACEAFAQWPRGDE